MLDHTVAGATHPDESDAGTLCPGYCVHPLSLPTGGPSTSASCFILCVALHCPEAEIVTASSNIYTGKVKNISFEIVNMKTGTADSSAASGKTDCMLYTVYTVDVLKSYKGDNSGEIKICVIGGIAGYRENEQYDALQAAGLYEQYNGIPVVDGGCSLAIDGEYLFCTSRTAGGYDFVINKTQFAHAVNSQNYTAITSAIS